MTTSTLQRLGDAFYNALFEAWQAEGPAVIERVRREHPAAYLKLIASVLPQQIAIDAEPLEFCADHDLEALRDFLAGLPDREGKAE